MSCPSCGRELVEGARFCDRCGAPQPPPAPGRKSGLVALFLVLGCLGMGFLGLALGTGWYFWQQSGGTLPVALGGPSSPVEDETPGEEDSSPMRDEASGQEGSSAEVGRPSEGGLAELAGVWSLRPGDPGHDPENPQANQVEFRMEEGILVARPPGTSGEALHLIERRGDELRGEYLEDGMATMFTGRVESGEMILEAEGETVRLVRAER